ncbi:methyl-accepting chemotaxis protein [Paenibacillus phyllosphaerae]|uniref:Methyl-accepting chemotaxis protein n=1 Tax=Paenibacillus phyllosphaerae TaxID=274593 RepID=A0A7W5AUU7_9BACL|nr:methyl-accepting chemotaxis protein [Paenibacillus phyllosphaerae]MBB3109087.1 methyl-accepting chemotaxis protein [Paenibacillus phyllosphaerae]
MKKRRISFNLKVKLILLLSLPVLAYIGSNFYWLNKYDQDMSAITQSLFHTTHNVNTLVLNADRDLYQALSAYEQLKLKQLGGADASAELSDMQTNAEQAAERMAQADEILQAAGMTELVKKDDSTTINTVFERFTSDYPAWKTAMEAAAAQETAVLPSELLEQFESLRGGLNLVGEILDEYAANQTAVYAEQLKSEKVSAYSGMGACTILIALVGFFLIRNMSRVVDYMKRLTDAVSAGDLREHPAIKRGDDELGQIAGSIEAMTNNLRHLIGTISFNANQVKRSSEQMQVASQQSSEAGSSVAVEIQDVSDGMETQTKAAEESARAMVEMAVGIGRVAENTSAISEYSSSTTQMTNSGKQQIEHLVKQMIGIKTILADLSRIVANLNGRSREIGQIAVQITSFSNQTNILSLNASIEAARAGEHGRGFTVVAEEIRKLAAGSLQSADVINQLVAATQDEVSSASGVMDRTLVEVEQGNQLLNEVTESFTRIQSSIMNIASQIHDNSAITEQMSASAEQVSATMEQSAHTAQMTLDSTRSVAAATEEQLALMEDITLAADQLRSIVDALTDSVASFKV